MSDIKVFEDRKVRTKWDSEKEDWWFSLVDVVGVLADTPNPTDYLKKLRKRDAELGIYIGTNCPQEEMVGATGKKRKVLVGNTKDVLRLVQSIPSKKAEPFKMWLAQVGSERLDEIADPEKAMQRGADFYRMKGYEPEWITQRLLSIKIRKELTDQWQERGIEKEQDYAILTNEMTRAWSGMNIKEYKMLKGLKKENLRDNMTDIELVLNMLAEVTTKNLSAEKKPTSFNENKKIARQGGLVAGNARKEIEKRLNKPIIDCSNAKEKLKLNTGVSKEVSPK